jgi:hypothetical protein
MRFEGLSLQTRTGLLRAPSGLALELISYFVRSASSFEPGVVPTLEGQRRPLYFFSTLSKCHMGSPRIIESIGEPARDFWVPAARGEDLQLTLSRGVRCEFVTLAQ